jgi:hypothetical protein
VSTLWTDTSYKELRTCLIFRRETKILTKFETTIKVFVPGELYMILTVDERAFFFTNWLKLLAYVNDEYNIIEGFGHPTVPAKLNKNDVAKIREKLWKKKSIIDKYLKSNKLEKDEYELVNSWKKFIKGNFIAIKESKTYCVMLKDDNDELYGVHGISNNFSVMIPGFPFMMNTVLIPFKDKIIYDSIILHHNIQFGPNYRRSYNEKYKMIKETKGIKLIL